MNESSIPNPVPEIPRLVVIGGVAGGASAAARARRLNESAEITILERGPDVSFANCGLPYFIGGEIEERDALAVQTPKSLKGMLNLDVRNFTEAVEIDRGKKAVKVRDASDPDGASDWISYDKLVLAPGAAPVRPPLPGIDDPRVLSLRNLQDMDRIADAAAGADKAVVIGAGFIGLEMAEQLIRLGKEVVLVELEDQVLPQMDPLMTKLVEDELRRNGVELVLGDGIARFEEDERLGAVLNSGRRIDADLAILSIGVRPETGLARDAGLEIGARGHIVVNEFMQTSDPDIYAAGDALETRDLVTGEPVAIPLGGPANRQGRVAADHIFRPDIARPYPGSLGTAIVRVFEAAAGVTGWTEKRLRKAGAAFESVTVNDNHHAGYFPGAKGMTVKLLWNPENGKVLGGQAAGLAGVDKRLDVLATAIAGGLTIDDLCHLELAYAPPFGSAKDPVNLAGFAAANMRDGLVRLVDALPAGGAAQIVDVRPKVLADLHPVEGVINIPFPTLRGSLDRLDRNRPVITVCVRGKMSYFAARILAQNGFDASSFTGGIMANIDPRSPAKPPKV